VCAVHAATTLPCAGKSSKNGASSKKGAHLEKLFAPPEHLMFHGPFALAKEQGKQSNKWVLVNLQDDGNFDCHILNRDVWKNEGVAAVVEHHFLLWQQTHSYGDGQAAMHMYHLDKGMLPAVLAIDPITGAEMKRLTGLIKPQDMLQWLLDFVRTHPAPDAARARADEDARLTALKRPRGESASRVAASVAAHTKQARGGSSGAAVKSAYAYTAGDDSDEYEYISDSDGDGGSGGGAGVSQASEQASPARQGRAEHPDSPAPPAPAASGDQGSSAAVPDIGNTKGGATPSQGGVGLPTPLTVTCISPEPAAGEGITRLQLRLPQGKRLVRRFASSEPVSILYAVAGALLSRPHILAGCYALHRVARSEAAANEVGLPDSITPQSATAALMEAAVSDDLVQGVQGGAAFDINTPYPTTSLREQGFKTLAEAKLLNSTVVVELS